MELSEGPHEDSYFPAAPFLRADLRKTKTSPIIQSYDYALIDSGSDLCYSPVTLEDILLHASLPSKIGYDPEYGDHLIFHCRLSLYTENEKIEGAIQLTD